jgi:hypothetical protein
LVERNDPKVLYLGTSPSTWDSEMYNGGAANACLLIAPYADDLVNAFDDLNTMLSIKCKLFEQFEIKDMKYLN